jgi:predicted metal-dependent hydrolase
MPSLQHQGRSIEYTIEHKSRVTRRIHLSVASDGGLCVAAPRHMRHREVHIALREMAPRVFSFHGRALARLREIPVYRYLSGERHLYRGEWLPLRVEPATGRRGHAELCGGELIITVAGAGPDTVRRKLQDWYRRQAGVYFSERLEDLAAAAGWLHGVAPPMRLRKMKRSWGSCSAQGVITLNPSLLKAPGDCIDYVIAHELCHLVEMNHGKAFYGLLEQLYPSWRNARAHLRAKSHVYLA